MHDFKIASGRSNKLFTDKVANHLNWASLKLLCNFSDGEIWVKFNDNVRGVDLFIIQSTFAPADNILELLMLINALSGLLLNALQLLSHISDMHGKIERISHVLL